MNSAAPAMRTSNGATALHPRPRRQLTRFRHVRDLRRRCASRRALVLTYDDGPGGDVTIDLLERLDDRGAHATFFLLGSAAVAHPGIVDRIVAEGHEIGCHGQDHVNAWRSWPWRAVQDIGTGYRSLSPWLPEDGMFRPPYGKVNPATWLALRRRNAPIVWWTIDSGDSRDDMPAPESVVEKVKRDGGGVVLMHDCIRTPRKAAFVQRATELLLAAAAAEGWTASTLGALLSAPERS